MRVPNRSLLVLLSAVASFVATATALAQNTEDTEVIHIEDAIVAADFSVLADDSDAEFNHFIYNNLKSPIYNPELGGSSSGTDVYPDEGSIFGLSFQRHLKSFQQQEDVKREKHIENERAAAAAKATELFEKGLSDKNTEKGAFVQQYVKEHLFDAEEKSAEVRSFMNAIASKARSVIAIKKGGKSSRDEVADEEAARERRRQRAENKARRTKAGAGATKGGLDAGSDDYNIIVNPEYYIQDHTPTEMGSSKSKQQDKQIVSLAPFDYYYYSHPSSTGHALPAAGYFEHHNQRQNETDLDDVQHNFFPPQPPQLKNRVALAGKTVPSIPDQFTDYETAEKEEKKSIAALSKLLKDKKKDEKNIRVARAALKLDLERNHDKLLAIVDVTRNYVAEVWLPWFHDQVQYQSQNHQRRKDPSYVTYEDVVSQNKDKVDSVDRPKGATTSVRDHGDGNAINNDNVFLSDVQQWMALAAIATNDNDNFYPSSDVNYPSLIGRNAILSLRREVFGDVAAHVRSLKRRCKHRLSLFNTSGVYKGVDFSQDSYLHRLQAAETALTNDVQGGLIDSLLRRTDQWQREYHHPAAASAALSSWPLAKEILDYRIQLITEAIRDLRGTEGDDTGVLDKESRTQINFLKKTKQVLDLLSIKIQTSFHRSSMPTSEKHGSLQSMHEKERKKHMYSGVETVIDNEKITNSKNLYLDNSENYNLLSHIFGRGFGLSQAVTIPDQALPLVHFVNFLARQAVISPTPTTDVQVHTSDNANDLLTAPLTGLKGVVVKTFGLTLNEFYVLLITVAFVFQATHIGVQLATFIGSCCGFLWRVTGAIWKIFYFTVGKRIPPLRRMVEAYRSKASRRTPSVPITAVHPPLPSASSAAGREQYREQYRAELFRKQALYLRQWIATVILSVSWIVLLFFSPTMPHPSSPGVSTFSLTFLGRWLSLNVASLSQYFVLFPRVSYFPNVTPGSIGYVVMYYTTVSQQVATLLLIAGLLFSQAYFSRP